MNVLICQVQGGGRGQAPLEVASGIKFSLLFVPLRFAKTNVQGTDIGFFG
jgi:hypothetical protein